MITGILQLLKSNRCGLLLATLVLFLAVHPTLREGRLEGVLVDLVGSFIVLTAIYAVAADRRFFALALGLAAIALAGTWTAQFKGSGASWIFANLSSAALFTYIVAVMLHYVLRDGKVTADKLFAATCIYFFFGLIGGRIYHALEIAVPGSFSGVSDVLTVASDDLYYFSFVTLTTLGYGDVAPATPQARCFAILEAIVGVLYLAILISRLAGQFRRQDSLTVKE